MATCGKVKSQSQIARKYSCHYQVYRFSPKAATSLKRVRQLSPFRLGFSGFETTPWIRRAITKHEKVGHRKESPLREECTLAIIRKTHF